MAGPRRERINLYMPNPMTPNSSMSNPNPSDPAIPELTPANQPPESLPAESFKDVFFEYEQSHSRKSEPGSQGREGTVITVTADSIVLDIGFKTEGVLPLTAFPADKPPKPGDKVQVTVKGRDPEGYYELTRGKVERPTDWASLEKAFEEKSTIIGTVTGVVKGGLSVDVGVRAFMPASRSGTRDASELERLVEQEIRCRVIKLDVAEEDVVVDRRAIAEDEERAGKQRRFSELKEGDTVQGEVRSLTDYGAFVDIGGADALLHVGEISWRRVNKPSDVLSTGQQIEAVIIKIDSDKRRIAISMKQLQPHPWDSVAEKYKAGERVHGTVTRLTDYGAVVELDPGIEGLIHISEMSWAKRVRTPSAVVKPGETVEAVILGVNVGERRISLGLKQALGDPWAGVAQKFAPGTVIEGPVTSLTKFGAFVQLTEGFEGMISVSEISAENNEGDIVTGRMVDVSEGRARGERGEGVVATCRMPEEKPAQEDKSAESESTSSSSSARPDLSSLGSMLQTRWKSGAATDEAKPEAARAGQIRKFRIAKLDPAGKRIELELE